MSCPAAASQSGHACAAARPAADSSKQPSSSKAAKADAGANYEAERQARIAANKQKLAEMGIVQQAQQLGQQHHKHLPPRPKHKRPVAEPADIVVRRSDRNERKPTPNYKDTERLLSEFEPKAKKLKTLTMRVALPRASGNFNPIASPHAQEAAFAAATEFAEAQISPTLVKPMLPSHVAGGFWLQMPAAACKHLPYTSKTTINLVTDAPLARNRNGWAYAHWVPDWGAQPTDTDERQPGRTQRARWAVEWLPRSSGAGLSGGWRGFALDHDLYPGDVTVFKVAPAAQPDGLPDTLVVYFFRAEEYEKGYVAPPLRRASATSDDCHTSHATADGAPSGAACGAGVAAGMPKQAPGGTAAGLPKQARGGATARPGGGGRQAGRGKAGRGKGTAADTAAHSDGQEAGAYGCDAADMPMCASPAASEPNDSAAVQQADGAAPSDEAEAGDASAAQAQNSQRQPGSAGKHDRPTPTPRAPCITAAAADAYPAGVQAAAKPLRASPRRAKAAVLPAAVAPLGTALPAPAAATAPPVPQPGGRIRAVARAGGPAALAAQQRGQMKGGNLKHARARRVVKAALQRPLASAAAVAGPAPRRTKLCAAPACKARHQPPPAADVKVKQEMLDASLARQAAAAAATRVKKEKAPATVSARAPARKRAAGAKAGGGAKAAAAKRVKQEPAGSGAAAAAAPALPGAEVAKGGDDEVYVVEMILGSRHGKGGRTEYLIRWHGYSAEWDTWEPMRCLDASPYSYKWAPDAVRV